MTTAITKPRRRRQSIQKALAKGIARVVILRYMNELVDILFDAFTSRSEKTK